MLNPDDVASLFSANKGKILHHILDGSEAPEIGPAHLLTYVWDSGVEANQIALKASLSPYIRIRYYNKGSWTSWEEYATKSYVDEITVGILTNGAGYGELVRSESETYYKSIKKNGKVVEFSFVFISKALVADKPYELFRVPYKPKSNLEVNIVSKLGRVLSFFCGASGIMVVMPFQAISEGDAIRLHATWICE